MSRIAVAFIHASPAAIAPLADYYSRREPDWIITNLLDDGIMRRLNAGEEAVAESGLGSLVERACSLYEARAALITCSAAGFHLVQRLQRAARIPLIKIDLPMARAAVAAGRRVGVLVSFPPALPQASSLLADLAAAERREVEILSEVRQDALQALLRGDAATHDRLLREGAKALRSAGAEVILLAQVSMAHLRGMLEQELGAPVFSSLETSHQALREALAR